MVLGPPDDINSTDSHHTQEEGTNDTPQSSSTGRDRWTTGLIKAISQIMSTAICQISMPILEVMFASNVMTTVWRIEVASSNSKT
jgi:hypothetical protein